MMRRYFILCVNESNAYQITFKDTKLDAYAFARELVYRIQANDINTKPCKVVILDLHNNVIEHIEQIV